MEEGGREEIKRETKTEKMKAQRDRERERVRDVTLYK